MSVSRIGSARPFSHSIQRSAPIRGFTPCRSASRWNFTIANRLPWSVSATAGMPAPATASMSRGTRTMPSTSEYSVCSRKWTNAGQPALATRDDMRGILPSHGRETLPVKPAGSDACQARQVVHRGITLVPLESVVRTQHGHAGHESVPGCLREDRRCTDLADERIALDDRFKAAAKAQHGAVRATVAVHADAHGRDREAEERSPHREQRGLQDIQYVNLGGIDPANGPGARHAADSRSQPLALRRRELLGVPQAGNRPAWVQDHGCRYDRPGQRSPAGFVDAGGPASSQARPHHCMATPGPSWRAIARTAS